MRIFWSSPSLRKRDGFKKLSSPAAWRNDTRTSWCRELPECDGVLGLGANGDIAEAVRAALEGEKPVRFPDKGCWPLDGERLQTTPEFFAYLRIGDGCSNCCSYCAIPLIRGPLRSRPMENVVEEAKKLAENGVRELVLVAQDTTLYGVDLFGAPRLPALLRELCRIDGLKWIRLLYCYPEHITEELLDVMAEEAKIAKYMDIPIQHVSGPVLAAMNRPGDAETLARLLRHIRERVAGDRTAYDGHDRLPRRRGGGI